MDKFMLEDGLELTFTHIRWSPFSGRANYFIYFICVVSGNALQYYPNLVHFIINFVISFPRPIGGPSKQYPGPGRSESHRALAIIRSTLLHELELDARKHYNFVTPAYAHILEAHGDKEVRIEAPDIMQEFTRTISLGRGLFPSFKARTPPITSPQIFGALSSFRVNPTFKFRAACNITSRSMGSRTARKRRPAFGLKTMMSQNMILMLKVRIFILSSRYKPLKLLIL